MGYRWCRTNTDLSTKSHVPIPIPVLTPTGKMCNLTWSDAHAVNMVLLAENFLYRQHELVEAVNNPVGNGDADTKHAGRKK